MKIILQIGEDNAIRLSLFDEKKELGSLAWQDSNNLSRVLLANLDKLLQKSDVGVDPSPISRGKNRYIALARNEKIEHLGAGRKEWAIRLSRRRKIPRQNWRGVDKISGYKIISEVPRKWTTYRIADITFQTLKIARLS